MFSCQRGSCWSSVQLLRKSSQLSILVTQLRRHWKMSFPAVDYASCSASERKLALWHSRKSAVWSALRQLFSKLAVGNVTVQLLRNLAIQQRKSQLSSYSLWRKSAAQLWSMEKVSRAAMIYVASQLSSYSLWRKSAVQLWCREKVGCPAMVYGESQLSSYGLWRKAAVQLRSMEKVSCPATVYEESQLSSYSLWRKSAVQLQSMEEVSCASMVYGESQL